VYSLAALDPLLLDSKAIESLIPELGDSEGCLLFYPAVGWFW